MKASTGTDLVIVAAGCFGGYELWDYYMLSPWTRDARVQADVVTIAPDVAGFVDEVLPLAQIAEYVGKLLGKV